MMADRRGKGSYDRNYTGVIRKVRVTVGLLALAMITFVFVLGVGTARDDGMRPAISAGRPLLYLRLDRDCRRGELAYVTFPDGTRTVRRVIAVKGDTVDVRDGMVYINGLAERGSYSYTRTDPAANGPSYPLLLKEGEIFVLGDNREQAVDSRSFGALKRDAVLGRVL
ncbi:MAG: signal peptidase I [Oscillospiraceae bacterium]|nr:signal peptidase I [Oscillospiraceae bacterium]